MYGFWGRQNHPDDPSLCVFLHSSVNGYVWSARNSGLALAVAKILSQFLGIMLVLRGFAKASSVMLKFLNPGISDPNTGVCL